MRLETIAAEFGFMTELERYESFLELYRSEDPAHKEALARLLSSTDPLVPLILLQYLEEIPERPAVEAILRLIEEGGEIVARAAMAVYAKNHYPGKARMLKALILSPSARACRFAVRTLSRAGFAEILPLVLREVTDREGAVRLEMIEALRYIPDRRSVPSLVALAERSDEPARLAALQGLVELQSRWRVLPAAFFLRRAQDESERVRRAALEALQRFPTRRVAPMILASALDKSKPDAERSRAIRSLGGFPSEKWVRPLVELCGGRDSAAIKLSAEVALRAFPPAVLRRGLMPLLRDADLALRRQAALLAADLLGKLPEVRDALLALWRGAQEDEAVELVDALRLLPGAQAADALASAVGGASPLRAYAAAGALGRMRGLEAERRCVELVSRGTLPSSSLQPLLDRWARRAPAPELLAQLRPGLLAATKSEVLNVRYLAARALGWYPVDEGLGAILDLLAVETNAELARTAARLLARGLGSDPVPLVEAVRENPRAQALVSHLARVLTSRAWDAERAPFALARLLEPPLELLERRPETFLSICVHLVEQGTLEIDTVKIWLDSPGRLRLFLWLMASYIKNPRRSFPSLPHDAIERLLAGADADTRSVYYDLLWADGGRESAGRLAAAVAVESDEGARRHGAARLRSLLLEGTA